MLAVPIFESKCFESDNSTIPSGNPSHHLSSLLRLLRIFVYYLPFLQMHFSLKWYTVSLAHSNDLFSCICCNLLDLSFSFRQLNPQSLSVSSIKQAYPVFTNIWSSKYISKWLDRRITKKEWWVNLSHLLVFNIKIGKKHSINYTY